MLASLISIVHVFVCILLIVIILLQQGKGADIGATFGGGGNTLFGASGADNLLTKVTTFLAFIFMGTSVFLAVDMKPSVGRQGSVMSSLPDAAPVETAPVESPKSESAPVEAPLGVNAAENTGAATETTAEASPTGTSPQAPVAAEAKTETKTEIKTEETKPAAAKPSEATASSKAKSDTNKTNANKKEPKKN